MRYQLRHVRVSRGENSVHRGGKRVTDYASAREGRRGLEPLTLFLTGSSPNGITSPLLYATLSDLHH